MAKAVELGDVPAYSLPGYVKAMVELDRLVFAADENKRASETHELKIAELRKRQAEALETVSKSSQLTEKQVAEIRLKVLGL